ncbi:cell division cycle protein 16 homolog [Homalodisca vitripennis]|uniref:cell division cycle protein 16 homolog n=1 Tax=Homalodisca vitripennis TaxID=197043 RepID=UPI001EEB02AE|nr:cell division cycle protein 16 homolog [Homalodisca vitripennis]
MTSQDNYVNIDRFRQKVRFYLDANNNETALFWAEKVTVMSGADARDVYWQAQCLFRSRQYHRAAALIRNKGLDKSQPLCQWLAGLCLLEARKYEDALLILSKDDTNQTVSVAMTSFSIPPIGEYCILEGFTPRGLQSALLLLKGQVYEKLENRAHAAEYFRIALKNDVYCYQAFHLLEQHHMLTSVEEKELLSSLPFKEQCYENDLLPAVYEILLNKYQSIPQMSLTPALSHPRLSESLDVEVARAEKLYHACAFRQCLSKTQE